MGTCKLVIYFVDVMWVQWTQSVQNQDMVKEYVPPPTTCELKNNYKDKNGNRNENKLEMKIKLLIK